MTETTGKLMTRQEVAKLLNLSPRTVSQYVAERRLSCVRFGHRTVRFRPSDVEKFVTRNQEL